MKKIVHLTSIHPCLDVRIFYKECLSLKQSGYNVTLIAQSDKDLIIDDIKIIAIKKTKSRLKRMTLLLWQIYRQAIKENADVYHFHDPELIVVGLLLRLHGKKVIYDVHEDVPRDILLKSWIKFSLRKLIAKGVETLEHFSARCFQGVVTVTPHINNRFQHASSIEVRNYPILTEFNIAKKSTGDLQLCYSGLINQQRGIFEMLRIAELTQSRLSLAGNFNSNEIETMVSLSKSANYLGYLDRKQLNEFYQKSSVGLALLHPGPTFNDSLPIKLFEYMAAGIPIIASDFLLWRDIIETHQCGYCVSPFNIELICEKINYLKANPIEAHEMGMRGRAAVEKYYNWQSESEKLLKLYQSILQ